MLFQFTVHDIPAASNVKATRARVNLVPQSGTVPRPTAVTTPFSGNHSSQSHVQVTDLFLDVSETYHHCSRVLLMLPHHL